MIFIKYMSDFSERIRSEIDYLGLSQKELAAEANVKIRALAMYLGAQQSMPPADVAVRIASVLGVSVEYLVTGKETKHSFKHPIKISKYIQFQDLLDDLLILPTDILIPIQSMIKTAAQYERKKNAFTKPAG